MKKIKRFYKSILIYQIYLSVFITIYDGEWFENKDAFETYKDLLIKVYLYMTRDITNEEKQDAILANASILRGAFPESGY